MDLKSQDQVKNFFSQEKPDYVFCAAAKVGGIQANSKYPADFIYDNLMIQCNLLESARLNEVKKFLFLGSSCIYPKFAQQPLKEDSLLTGSLEETNVWYAIAKIAGIKLSQAYKQQYGMNCIAAMPTNLYGPKDNYDLENSHVLPALIKKSTLQSKKDLEEVEIWGTGEPRREFLYVDDLADGLIFLMKNYDDDEFVNIGYGDDITIKELAVLVSEIIGFEGKFKFNLSKPDGTPQNFLIPASLMG